MRIKLIVFLFFITSIFYAHPHTFIDYKATVCFNYEGIEGVEATWYFDEMFSSYVAMYDADSNKKFSEQELKKLKAEAFDNLKEYHYFAKFYIDGKVFYPEYIKDFYSFFEDGKIVYRFFIPCTIKSSYQEKDFVVMFFDPTYYIHVAPVRSSPIIAREAQSHSIELTKKIRKQDAYYQGMIVPEGFEMRIKKK